MRVKPFDKGPMRVLTLSFVMLTLSGCASRMGFAETDLPVARPGAQSFCDLARPILWSTRDTDETIRAVKEQNAVGVRLCGWSGADG